MLAVTADTPARSRPPASSTSVRVATFDDATEATLIVAEARNSTFPPPASTIRSSALIVPVAVVVMSPPAVRVSDPPALALLRVSDPAFVIAIDVDALALTSSEKLLPAFASVIEPAVETKYDV